MILDLDRFIRSSRSRWRELETELERLESGTLRSAELPELERLFYLYERAAADLARLNTFAAAPEVRDYLEALVGRAYAEIHETRTRPHRLRPVHFLLRVFPRTFRRHLRPFLLACALTLLGALFGSGAVLLDLEAKAHILPFSQLLGDPSDRVAEEERAEHDALAGNRQSFSAMLMTHNIRVGLLCLALGMTWGFGTLVLLYYNGVILGAVCLDYVRAGEAEFLAGWLLPHGAIEIPAILIAGQAGLVLASALIGRGDRLPVTDRLRRIGPDLVVLVAGFALLLVWAGIVESFFSQFHEPVLPYALKIAFGSAEVGLLALWLGRSGSEGEE